MGRNMSEWCESVQPPRDADAEPLTFTNLLKISSSLVWYRSSCEFFLYSSARSSTAMLKVSSPGMTDNVIDPCVANKLPQRARTAAQNVDVASQYAWAGSKL